MKEWSPNTFLDQATECKDVQFVDVDRDGDVDVVITNSNAMTAYLRTSAGFVEETAIFAQITVGACVAPAFADIENGKLSVVVGDGITASILCV